MPGPVGGWTRRSAWRSWARFGCQDGADWLSAKRLASWLQGAGYRGRTDPASLYQRLRSAPRGVTGEQGAPSAQVTRALAAVLASLNTQITALETQIAGQLAAHADGHIFTSRRRRPPRSLTGESELVSDHKGSGIV
jgi:transposase